ncbi:30S ribosomal protein S6 [Puniceicoccus vermicola]|uniref:Small ribosomal subunit protein bS6 n=1 Tax=Puniceicoccus vermicola TaxID=388746 RepID=A0A7X1AYM3_9BACT|nr:30S ribosomal protein S6 [Puniceicoccus vermicola]MBC2602395.1 30S ribosomal protein S6 [Puniceicoccus vermicola]
MIKQTSRNYRATFVLDTRGVESSVEELTETYSKVIEEVSGKVESVKNLGSKDFARKAANGLPSGIFVQYEFIAPATAPEEIQEKVRLDRKVNRVMVEHA